MNDLLSLSLTELCARLTSRKASPVELMDAVLDRIDERNGDLNAFVALHDRSALQGAARAAEERIGRGEARALEGIPLGVKDLEDTVGLPNTKGSLPFKDEVPDHDTTQVARLKAAGAIVVGKTNAPEFGYTAITKNLVYAGRLALPAQHRERRWGLDPHPGELRRGLRAQGLLRARAPRPEHPVGLRRHLGLGSAHEDRGRRRAPARRHLRCLAL
jgi:hypothetical protein